MTDVPYTFTSATNEQTVAAAAHVRYRDYSDFQAENPETTLTAPISTPISTASRRRPIAAA